MITEFGGRRAYGIVTAAPVFVNAPESCAGEVTTDCVANKVGGESKSVLVPLVDFFFWVEEALTFETNWFAGGCGFWDS